MPTVQQMREYIGLLHCCYINWINLNDYIHTLNGNILGQQNQQLRAQLQRELEDVISGVVNDIISQIE